LFCIGAHLRLCGGIRMTMRIARFAAVTALVLSSVVSNHASTGVTLVVPGRASANVSIASSGLFVAAVWSASAPAGATDVYASASRDGGRTFSAAVRVNSVPGDARVNGEQPPRLALRDRAGSFPEIAVVWTTKGNAGTRLMSGSSLDGGRTFSPSAVVPGSDAPGNRGWEAVGAGPGGHFFSVWLDHRKLAPPQQMAMAGEHHHENGAMPMPMPTPAASTSSDGVAMAQLSQLYVASLDGSVAPKGVTGGVCYCCKTAIAAGPANALYLAWRHVYAGNMRDIAFTVSRDGGTTFSSPVRVSEDKWQIEGCPDDGPSMGVDRNGAVHIVWPTVVTEHGGPVKALFHAMTRDGRSFSARVRIPTTGQANHPQLAVGADGATLMIVWDESGSGSRHLASATGRVDREGHVQFTRAGGPAEAGTYPVVASAGAGAWVRAWTAGDPSHSEIHVARMP
jgi:hypothetical protein